MSVPRTLFIVTSPSRDVSSTRLDVEAARRAKADLVEVRLDLWSTEERGRLGSLFPSALPLIATLRSRSEGGEGPDRSADRTPILAAARRLPFAFVDREAERDEMPAEGARASSPSPGQLRSRHLAENTSRATLVRALLEPAGSAAIVKVVIPATLTRVWTEILPLLHPQEEYRPVIHTTGPSGPLLRVLSRDLGMPAVFCAPADRWEDPGNPTRAVEPAQIPINRLVQHFASTNPSGPRFAVLGHPVQQSLSPMIHSRWMSELDLPGVFIALDVETEPELSQSVSQLSKLGFRGLSITHPWKEPALRLASSSSRAAELCGCANTLTLVEDQVEAENTDLAANLQRLEGLRERGQWDGTELTVIGSGGAARASLAAARLLGAKATVVARVEASARLLAEQFGAVSRSPFDPHPATLLIHATPVGQVGAGELSFPLAPWLAREGYLLDYVYSAVRPTIVDAARERSATYEDGRGLLVEQAAAAFELWWGTPPDRGSFPDVLGGVP